MHKASIDCKIVVSLSHNLLMTQLHSDRLGKAGAMTWWVIIISSEFLKHPVRAKHREPAYASVRRQVRGVVQRWQMKNKIQLSEDQGENKAEKLLRLVAFRMREIGRQSGCAKERIWQLWLRFRTKSLRGNRYRILRLMMVGGQRDGLRVENLWSSEGRSYQSRAAAWRMDLFENLDVQLPGDGRGG